MIRLNADEIERISQLVIEDLHNDQWREASIYRGQTYLAVINADPANFDIKMLSLLQILNRAKQITKQEGFDPNDVETIYNKVFKAYGGAG